MAHEWFERIFRPSVLAVVPALWSPSTESLPGPTHRSGAVRGGLQAACELTTNDDIGARADCTFGRYPTATGGPVRVLIVGATGRTGQVLAAQARDAGHAVVGMARSASESTLPKGVIPIAGSATDRSALTRALQGVDAVITALSVTRKTRSPFAALTAPPDLHSQSTRLLLELLPEHNIRRLIKISAQGVGDSKAGLGFRALVQMSNLRPAFVDHGVADQMVRESPLDWTILRPPILSEGPPRTLEAGEGLRTFSWTKVPLTSVAEFAVGALPREDTYRKVLTLR